MQLFNAQVKTNQKLSHFLKNEVAKDDNLIEPGSILSNIIPFDLKTDGHILEALCF